jgi:outer membrane protein TolC
VVLALLSSAAPATAQTVLSEADALARLSPDSPRVRAIRAGIELVRADVLAAGRWPNPRFTFNRESVAGVTENMFLVSQPLPITGRRNLEMSAASALVEAGARRADDNLRQARTELRHAYADLLFAQVREDELTRARDRLRELANVLSRREAAGDAAGYDRLRAEREVMDLEAERALARADRVRAQATLGHWWPNVAFTSVTDLRRKLMRYIKHYNTTATPIRWSYADPSRRIA